MTRYQLAKIVDSVGTLRSRKRIQKMAYLLKVAGFPTDAEFFPDVIGPYSFDVAMATNELTQIGLLTETEHATPRGPTFDYQLTDRARTNPRSRNHRPGATLAFRDRPL